MAKYCPSACGRLATAAILIVVGIVQVIDGIILLKSDYAFMLSGPNIWTALCNLTVGVLLGVASTVWKTINKNSKRHASRRKLLAALVGSIFILNATTAAMLIVGEGNIHLAIHLESGGFYSTHTFKQEILAYAYATSVCSSIVCVVVSIAFLTGICFRQKPKTVKTLDFKSILNHDDSQMYDWVYTSNLPKPDPEILKSALSSESESSSSESDSDSSSDLPVPLHLRSRSPLSDIKNSRHGSLQSSSLQSTTTSRMRSLEDSVDSPDFGNIRNIPRLINSSLIKTPVYSYNEPMKSRRSVGLGRRLMPAYKSDGTPGTPIRIGDPRILEKSPNFQFNADLSPYGKTKLYFSPMNHGTANRLQMIKRARDGPSACRPLFMEDSTEYEDTVNFVSVQKSKCVPKDGSSTSRNSSMEDSNEYEDTFLSVPDLPNPPTPNPHSEIRRTSTTDQSKAHQELENLDNSAIHFDAGITAFKEIYLDETLPEIKDKDKLSSSSFLTDSTTEGRNGSLRSGGDMSIYVRNSNFRKKLSSRLVPASGPVISDRHSFHKTSNRKSIRNGRVKPYSKSKSSYDKYLQTGFSSFQNTGQGDEVDAMAYSKNSNGKKSPVTSLSEKSALEESYSFLPSSSTHTSGYMSASYEESEDETDLKPNPNHQPSSAQKLIADEIRERYRKRTQRVSFESDKGR